MTADRTCPNCGWTGQVILYNIGDGPEWCCRSCDSCFPSRYVVGPDGMSNGERKMMEAHEEAMRQLHPEWFEPGTKVVTLHMGTGVITEETM